MSTFNESTQKAAFDHENAWLNAEKPFVAVVEQVNPNNQEQKDGLSGLNTIFSAIHENQEAKKQPQEKNPNNGPSFDKYQHEGSSKGGKY